MARRRKTFTVRARLAPALSQASTASRGLLQRGEVADAVAECAEELIHALADRDEAAPWYRGRIVVETGRVPGQGDSYMEEDFEVKGDLTDVIDKLEELAERADWLVSEAREREESERRARERAEREARGWPRRELWQELRRIASGEEPEQEQRRAPEGTSP